MRWLAVATLLLGMPRGGWAQREAPLLKTDLIALLSSPVIPIEEIAALVRRNCLAFRPTDRDVADFRRLGASGDVLASIAGCATRPTSPPPAAPAVAAAPAALQVVVRQPRLLAAAGSQAHIVVLAARGGIPQAGVPLALRGTATVDGGTGRDLVAVTDDSGFAVFPVRVGRRLHTYHFEVAPADRGTLPRGPVVELGVRPGPAASIAVEPREVLFDEGLDSVAPVVIAVRDSIGYAVVGERVVVSSSGEDMGFSPDTAVTDSLGRARVPVARSAVRRAGTLQVSVRGRPLGWVAVVLGMPLSDAGTGFVPLMKPVGAVHDALSQPLVFEARTRLGRPAAGR
jgi:hypothetical protein